MERNGITNLTNLTEWKEMELQICKFNRIVLVLVYLGWYRNCLTRTIESVLRECSFLVLTIFNEEFI